MAGPGPAIHRFEISWLFALAGPWLPDPDDRPTISLVDIPPAAGVQ
jgi:hypothetical protein